MVTLAWDRPNVNLQENSESREQRDILDALPVLVFLERAGRLIYANAEARHVIGWEGDWQECATEEILWGLSAGTAEPRTPLAAGRHGSSFHATLACRDGRMIPLEGTSSTLNAERREAIIAGQVTGRERAPRPGLMEDVLACLPEAVALVVGSRVLYINPAFTALFGYTADEMSGATLRDLIVPETRRYEYSMLQKLVKEQGHAAAETVRLHKNGELIDVAVQAAALRVAGGNAGYVVTFRDISDRKHVEARLQHDAMHDVLTGLPNRALFVDRLNLALSRRDRRPGNGCAVLFLDLDGFKQINDTFGHASGDMLLVSLAERLQGVIRPHDTAARMGGDEFAVLVENIQSISDLEALAQRLLAELDRPFDLAGHVAHTPASIGIALAGEEHLNAERLIQDADTAMYRAKQQGGHGYAIFDTHMEVEVSSIQERERELRDLVARRAFAWWYQPIYRLATGRLEGFECLLRKPSPAGSMESFRELLPIAEDTGLSITIGRETVESACSQLAAWDLALPNNALILTINLSRRQFFHDDLVPHLRKAISTAHVDPGRLLLEISEDTLNESPDRAIAILQRLTDAGVRLAMDNFGATLAPLNLLVRLPIDMVKLDIRLTASATGSGRQLAVLQSLVSVCSASGLQLLAHGIETGGHLRALRDLGCPLGQGFFLAPPLDPAQAFYLVSQNSAANPPAGA